MAEKKRKNARQRAEEQSELPSWTDGIPLSPPWWAPVFVTLLIIGLIWLLVYYLSGAQYPIPGITHWNIAIGIGFLVAGFLMTLRWR